MNQEAPLELCAEGGMMEGERVKRSIRFQPPKMLPLFTSSTKF